MVVGFLFELEVACVPRLVERAVINGHYNITAGLLGMGAIGVAAVVRQVMDIREPFVHSVACPEKSQFPHARRIQDHRATVEHMQLAPRCGVDAFAGSADRLCFECIITNQAIDKCRLSHTG